MTEAWRETAQQLVARGRNNALEYAQAARRIHARLSDVPFPDLAEVMHQAARDITDLCDALDAAAGRAETACATCGDETCDGETYHERHGRWGPRVRRRAFVEGATWWEYTKTGATMWPSDRTQAEQEAERRYAAPAPPAPPAPSPEAKARDG